MAFWSVRDFGLLVKADVKATTPVFACTRTLEARVSRRLTWSDKIKAMLARKAETPLLGL